MPGFDLKLEELSVRAELCVETGLMEALRIIVVRILLQRQWSFDIELYPRN